MNYPLISEYVDAIKAAEDNFDQLKHLRPVLDWDGLPVMNSGNFAVVFKMKDEQTGKLYAVKCFTKEQEGRAEAYREITKELENVLSPYLTFVRYFDKELFVDTGQTTETEFPILLMDWVEGKTLDKYLRENLDDKYALGMLAYRFCQLAQWLIPQPFAHGDLKPDNILVRENGTLVLVDYDGMYVPAMKGQKARELGSPDFRHPCRTEKDFDEHIDDFAIVSILISLKGVAMDSNMLNDYGASDRLLFSKDDYLNISRCEVLKKYFPSEDNEWNNIISWWMIYLNDKTCYTLPIHILSVQKPSFSPVITNDEEYYWTVSDEDIAQAWVDKDGAKYSKDKKRLLFVPAGLSRYTIRRGTKVICESAFAGCEDMLSVVIPEGVIKIGPEAFQYCSQLNHITIPSSVTSIGNYVFSGCDELYSIDIPDSITEVGEEVFEEIPWFENQEEGLLYVGKVAYKYIGDPANLSTIDIKDGTVEIGKDAFSLCYRLEFIHIPDSVLKISDNAFYGCALKHIDLPKHLESIGQFAFYGCSNLTEVKIPEHLTTIEHGVFEGCSSLTNVEIPPTIKRIGYSAFCECRKLQTITIPNTVESIGFGAFERCSNLNYIFIPRSIRKIESSTFSDCTALSEINIPDSINEIESYAFRGCVSLKEVTIPDSVTVMDDSVFSGCYNLRKIKLPTHITKLEMLLFNKCKNLESIVIPDEVYTINSYAFMECISLKSIEIPESVRVIHSCAFKDCITLSNIILHNNLEELGQEALDGSYWYQMKDDGLVTIGGVVYKYKGTIEKNSDVYIPDSIIGIADAAFAHQSGLRSIRLPNSLEYIGNNAFRDCIALTAISLPDRITRIGNTSFINCSRLTSITIPPSVVSIGDSAFQGCHGLKQVYMSDSINQIDKHAFDECKSLEYIVVSEDKRSMFEKLFPTIPLRIKK